MVSVIDPSSVAFLLAESRQTPMHVGGMQLFEKPEDAGPGYVRELYEAARDTHDVAELFKKHPHRSLATAGQWVWREDELFDIEHHVRHSALPEPGRVRELLDLCGRLHGSPLSFDRPLWESHLIEGLADGRVAMYTKIHHALVDGVSSMRLLRKVLTTDPDERDLPPPWAKRPPRPLPETHLELAHLAEVPVSALRSALSLTAEAAGLPAALLKTLSLGARNETSTIAFHAPRTMLNQPITGARRFAAQDWSIPRLKAVGAATDSTLNDVVLAMCGGALRSYLREQGALPDTSLIAMVPVSLHARARTLDKDGGNAVGMVMARLGTEYDDAADRLTAVKESMRRGKQAIASMTPTQILAASAVGLSPMLLNPLLRVSQRISPPFNVIISNVPGPVTTKYYNGAKLVGMYPLSIPYHGVALNITCTSYVDQLGFGLTGCRRTVPHLQRLLTFLEDELAALEKASGL